MQEITPPGSIVPQRTFLPKQIGSYAKKFASRGRNIAVKSACSPNEPAGEHGCVRALSPFSSHKISRDLVSRARLEPGWIRPSPENYERNFGEISSSRFLSVAGAGDLITGHPAVQIAEQQ